MREMQIYTATGTKYTRLILYDITNVICFSIPIIKPTRCTNFSNLFLEYNSTCFGQFLCPSSGVFHCTHSNGICHTGLLTACEQDQDGSSIPVLLTSCITYTTAVRTVKNFW